MHKNAPRKDNPLCLLLRAIMIGSSSEAIWGQEADGQSSVVGSDTFLPTKMLGNAKEVLEAAGVQFLGIVEDDPMFRYVVLPKGWQIVATDHPMWSNLVDNKGRTRAIIFFKATPYDRRAHVSVNRRFDVGIDYKKLDEGVAEAIVTDCDKEIFRSVGVEFDPEGDYDLRCAAQDEAITVARQWLIMRYPDWENPAAYWD
ncbi:MAG: hypothetical protein KatS3mg085_517 [Candidatus Dojkabacteria bacterium]|nr:MAG: hypothetical protein KatS3mg085_517 [Candidatus Dojkabacteria bacterium]